MIITNTLRIKEFEEPDNYPDDEGCSDQDGEECDNSDNDSFDDDNSNVNNSNVNNSNGNNNNGNNENCYVFDVLPATGESSSVIYIVTGLLLMFSICGVFFGSLRTVKK